MDKADALCPKNLYVGHRVLETAQASVRNKE